MIITTPTASRIKGLARSITITPISLNPNNNFSRQNYDIELKHYANGFNMKWTDAIENNSRVGDLFAFVIGAGTSVDKPCHVRIHRVVAIDEQKEVPDVNSVGGTVTTGRRPDWHTGHILDHETHKNRNILTLSECILEKVDWEVFAEALGWQAYTKTGQRTPVQRTSRTRLK
jgi:hypothetical protein